MDKTKTNKKLDKLMKQSGISQTDMADKMGFSRMHLYSIRRNPSLMSMEQAEKLADILEVNFEVIQRIHQEDRD